MEEGQKNEKKPEFNGNLGFIWLVGILVILLGCTIVYVCKLKKEVNDLKQAPQLLSAAEQKKKEQKAIMETKTDETVKTEEKKEEVEDKDSIKVIGLNNRFTELSKAAVKGYSTKSVKTIKYDLNNDGKEETIQLKKSGNDGYDEACVDMYYQDKKIDKEIYIGYEEGIQDSNLYIVDLDRSDNLLDVIIAGFEDNNGFLFLNIYKNTGKTLKRINYKSDKTVSANGEENDNWVGRFYINSNNEFFELSNVEVCFDKVVTYKYYKIENNKAVSKKANIDKIKKETFKVLTDKEMIFYIDHKKFNYDKDYKNHKTFKNDDKVKILEWIDGNEIKAELNGKTIYIMPAHGYLAG